MVVIANSVACCVMSDGKMRLGLYQTAQATPTVPVTHDEFCEIMAAIPETAPRGENHLLRSGRDVRRITYSEINYSTMGASYDVLVVAADRQSVIADGQRLPRLSGAGAEREGWFYDPATRALRIRRRRPEVQVHLRAKMGRRARLVLQERSDPA